MILVCSDIHGDFQVYNKIVNKLTKRDKLYILGDVIDRKADGIKIIQDIMKRDNVELLLGNHEWFLLSCVLTNWSEGLVDGWTDSQNSGLITMKNLLDLSEESYNELIKFLRNCPIYKRIKVNDRYVNLVHGTYDSRLEHLANKTFDDILFNKCKGYLSEGSILFDSLWDSPLKTLSTDGYKAGELYIHGHVPLRAGVPYKIEDFIIFIDGGAVYGGNQILYNLTEDTYELI